MLVVEERRGEWDCLSNFGQPPTGFLMGKLADLGAGHTCKLDEYVLDGLKFLFGEYAEVRFSGRHQTMLRATEKVFLEQAGFTGRN